MNNESTFRYARVQTGLRLPAALLVLAAMNACSGNADADRSDDTTTLRAVAAAQVPVAPRKCNDCGTVSAIETLKVKGDASGAGAVTGALVGGVIGHQIGGGRGNDVATAAGVIGGAITGHQIERRINGEEYYRVSVAMEAGDSRTLDIAALNGISVGSKVRVVGQDLQLL
ncbi:glycine zipper 2TM domain-containing protein [Sinimarinibacterium sp. CAU 1509]|uniref:glycine zipper 2TM domain-containing protein n=1 Tax=Sinimarinibacterium sp. CAU 1509 TaxID=2562283 RepID=UPI0010AD8D37|nr:glycine zipper 2TM domain-containing protein [Sinimarinibacterium sp. CAU 1509]TJY60944.1 glycine zipper 2TM domain-containing protein [Sinimarinibacterium sp. CAU 1509]